MEHKRIVINTGKSLFTEPCRKKKNHENQNKNTQLQGHTCSVNRDFPVLVPSFQCFYYRVFPALVTTFPCFGYIFSLFNLRVFLCFSKISDLQGFPCIGYNFFMFQIQGFPCFNNIFFLFWLYYFPVLWTFFLCFIYRVFPVFPKFYVVVFQRAGKSLLWEHKHECKLGCCTRVWKPSEFALSYQKCSKESNLGYEIWKSSHWPLIQASVSC